MLIAFIKHNRLLCSTVLAGIAIAVLLVLLLPIVQLRRGINASIEKVEALGGTVSVDQDIHGPWAISFDIPGRSLSLPEGFIVDLSPYLLNLRNLDSINLNGCHLNQDDIAALTTVVQVSQISLERVDMTCDELKLLATMPNLRKLWLSQDAVNLECIDEIRKHNPKVIIEVVAAEKTVDE